jgi:hypothetical protein
VQYWWGATIASSGVVNASMNIPNATANPTWQYMNDHYTWQAANSAGITWSTAQAIVTMTTVGNDAGTYARKFLKFKKKVRFRQAFYQINIQARPNNNGADACVRIYDLSTFISAKETVVKQTT